MKKLGIIALIIIFLIPTVFSGLGENESCSGIDNNCDDCVGEGCPDNSSNLYWCNDSDGGFNLHVPGHIFGNFSLFNATTTIDTCSADGKFLSETFCLNSSIGSSSNYDCAYHCDSGACVNYSICGNGIIEPGEECDDNNTIDGDGCSSTCMNETPEYFCNDSDDGRGYYSQGFVFNGTNRNNGSIYHDSCVDPLILKEYYCTNVSQQDEHFHKCKFHCNGGRCVNHSVCGNGIVEPYEACDDGNLLDGDNCSNDCFIETEFGFEDFPEMFIPGKGFLGDVVVGGSDNPGAVLASIDIINSLQFHLLNESSEKISPGHAMLDSRKSYSSNRSFIAVGSPCKNNYVASSLNVSISSEECLQSVPNKNMGYVKMFKQNPPRLIVTGHDYLDVRLAARVIAERDKYLLKGNEVCVRGTNFSNITIFNGSCIEQINGSGFSCGNGIIEPGEECDDNNTIEGDGCSSSCINETPEYFCNDSDGGQNFFARGLLTGQLHPGSVNQTIDTCLSDSVSLREVYCVNNSLGQSFVHTCHYHCDSGACVNYSICGNGIIEPGEECDDNNTIEGDGCSSSCINETPEYFCNDSDGGQNFFARGLLTGQLHPGSVNQTIDTCLSDSVSLREVYCVNNSLGQSFVHTCHYHCDSGACVNYSICGNGIIEPGEECDDNNTIDGDGCSSSCINETPEYWCQDTDGGIREFRKGITRVCHGQHNNCTIFRDRCSYKGKTLQEFYCQDYSYNYSMKNCSFGCFKGKCVKHNPRHDIDKDNITDSNDTDIDNDGYNNSEDKIWGNEKSIVKVNIDPIVEIDNKTNFSGNISGERSVKIKDKNESNKTIVEINYNFSKNRMNLYNVSVQKHNVNGSGGMLVKGLKHPENGTKNIYVNRLNPSIESVCISDKEMISLSEISRSCNSSTEVFLRCNNQTYNGYRCWKVENQSRFKVTGLRHSGVLQQCPDVDGDGFYEQGCGTGRDCDDTDKDVNPDENETCDDVDNDCDGNIDEGCESDDDGGSSGGGGGS